MVRVLVRAGVFVVRGWSAQHGGHGPLSRPGAGPLRLHLWRRWLLWAECCPCTLLGLLNRLMGRRHVAWHCRVGMGLLLLLLLRWLLLRQLLQLLWRLSLELGRVLGGWSAHGRRPNQLSGALRSRGTTVGAGGPAAQSGAHPLRRES